MELKRDKRIIMTTEARVLRELRLSKGYSMRKAGELIGKSDSFIAQIESGRMDVPTGERLEQYLAIYGLKLKSFKERVRLFKPQITPQDELIEIIKRMDQERFKLIFNFAKTLASQGMTAIQ